MSLKHRERNSVMLVNNDEWNDRFFKACQAAKDGRFMNQQVNIIAWKAYRRGGLIDFRTDTKIDITLEAMSGQKPPSFSKYIELLNQHDQAGINDDGAVLLSLTIEVKCVARKKVK